MTSTFAGADEIVYASLGSGELLLDFFILERLLAAGLRVSQAHFIDPLYEPRSCTGYAPARLALAQLASWFSDTLIYAHPSMETWAVQSKRAESPFMWYCRLTVLNLHVD